MSKYTLEDLRFYQSVNSKESIIPYIERPKMMIDRFGTDEIRMSELIDGLDDKYSCIVAGRYDSPGYDMTSYVVAWLQDGEIRQECFVEEDY